MAEAKAATGAQPGFFTRNDYLLRRLHSLAGIVPLALFMMEHMFSNMEATKGPDEFHAVVSFLTGLPALYVIEVLFIFLPLYFHGIYGVVIWTTGKSNLRQYGEYKANWRYSFQRWSGIFVVLFVTYHLLHWRFGLQLPWQTAEGGIHWVHYTTVTGGPGNLYDAMHAEFSRWPMFVFYLLGLGATMYHLGNGLWTFAITWGLTRTRAAQKRWGYVCVAFAGALFIAGVLGLVGFAIGGGMGSFQRL